MLSSRSYAETASYLSLIAFAVSLAGCGLLHSTSPRLSQERFYGMAFIAYPGPLQPFFRASADVSVPRVSKFQSSPSLQFYIAERNLFIEGGLMRTAAQPSLRAFVEDIIGGRRVLRELGLVGERSHTISIRGSAGHLDFLVDGRTIYMFKAIFRMDSNSLISIGTFADIREENRPTGRIWNISVTANGRDLGRPLCMYGSGGIYLAPRGSKWELQGEYDSTKGPIKVGFCKARRPP